jgi:hypothetical protein
MAGKRTVLPLIAIATFAVSWFVPVHRAGAKIGAGELPGWQAFRLALSRIWPLSDVAPAELPAALLAPASALTNFWFVIAAFLLLRRPAGPRPVLKWGLLVSVALNLWWFVFGMDRGDLLPGYYLWVASFVILAFASFDRSAGGEARG